VAPTADALGLALAEVMESPGAAERLGTAARAVADTMSWARVAATLGRPL
jgi:hypothetical protein